jgi:hypothetical protein
MRSLATPLVAAAAAAVTSAELALDVLKWIYGV